LSAIRYAILAAEKLLDLGSADPVEIVGHSDLPGHEAEPVNSTRLRRFRPVRPHH